MRTTRFPFWLCPVCNARNGEYHSICERCSWLPSSYRKLIVRWSFLPLTIRTSLAKRRAARDQNFAGRRFKQAASTITRSGSTPNKYDEVRIHRFNSWVKNEDSGPQPVRKTNAQLSELNLTPQATTDALQRLSSSYVDEPQVASVEAPNVSKSAARPGFYISPRAPIGNQVSNSPNLSEPNSAKTSSGVNFSKPKPPARIFDLTPETFEWYCAEWCVYLGGIDVQVTRATKDGGVDVKGRGFVAQVKLQELQVGVKSVRELAGVASAKKTFGYFFSLNGFSSAALAEAEELQIALFQVKPFTSEITPLSELARLLLEDAELG